MTKLFFADERVKKAFDKLKKSEFRDLHKFLLRAFKDVERNPTGSGISIRKELIPEVYLKKYRIRNLFKYDLPAGWRLLYSVKQEGIEVIAIILEWMQHKEYEKRFKYRVR